MYSSLLCCTIWGALKMVQVSGYFLLRSRALTPDAVGLFYARRSAAAIVVRRQVGCGCKSYPTCDMSLHRYPCSLRFLSCCQVNMEVECTFVRDVLQASCRLFWSCWPRLCSQSRISIACPCAQGCDLQADPTQAAAALQASQTQCGACAGADFPPLLPPGLQGDDANEMRLKLLSSSTETYPFKDE